MRIKEFFDEFDIKGGAIMAIWSVTIIVLSTMAMVWQKEIPSSVITAYGMAIGCYAVNKTMIAIKQ